jgi:opacity protein-like surface antigen
MLPATSFAADMPVKAPPKAAWVDSWAGPYIGAYFGAGAGQAAESFTGASASDTITTLNGAVVQTSARNQASAGNMAGDMTGSMVDLFAGYNWRIGNFVVGGQVEGTAFSDVALKTIGTQTTTSVSLLNGGVTSSTSSFGTTENSQQLRSRVGLIGRVGFLATPNLLLYGLGGLELGHFVYPDGNDPFGGNNGKWVAGYTVGAGGEARLDEHWSLRAEYRYLHFDVNRNETDFGTQTQVTGAAVANSLFNAATARQTAADFHLGKIGLVYRFGPAGPLSAMAAMPPAPGAAWGDSWAGPYFGAYFGAGAGPAKEAFTTTANNVRSAPGSDSTFSQTSIGNLAGNMTGSMVDLFAGYNWRTGNFVIGGQAEGTLLSDVTLKPIGTRTFSSVSTTNGVVDSTSSGFFTAETNQQLRSRVGLIGRAGFLATPDVLLYGLGGLEFGHFAYPDSGDQFGGSSAKWVAGYTAGAGGEVRLDDHWSLRGEYRYLHFDVNRDEANSNTQTGTTTVSTNSTATVRQTRADFNLGKIGVVYRFGGSGPVSAMAAIPSAVRSTWSDGWAGPYIGAYFGAGAGRAKQSVAEAGNETQTSPGQTVQIPQSSNASLAGDMTGSMVDLFAGYNWRAGNFVVGGQIEGTVFSDVALKAIGTETLTSPQILNGVLNNTFSLTDTVDNNQRLRSMVGVIGRVGFLATPDLLLYGLGGLALGHFTYPDGNDRFGAENGKWVAGYTVGAGGELKVAAHWSLRAEYRYLHFNVNRDEANSSSQTQVQGGITSVVDFNDATARPTAADFHLGKIGLVYRFGEGPVTAMAAMPVKAVRAGACCDSWAGVYFGAYFGSGKGRANEAFTDIAAATDTISQPGQPDLIFADSQTQGGNLAGHMTGSMVDLFAGYNWRAGNFVVGGQAEGTVFSDVTLKTLGVVPITFTSTAFGVTTTIPGTVAAEMQQQLRSRFGLIGRVGFLARPNLLLYGLGGLELGHFAYPDNNDILGGQNSKWVAGYTAGAGAELKLTNHWSLRGEYRYMHFNVERNEATSSLQTTADAAGVVDVTVSSETITHRTGADFHLAKIGAAYTFCYCD